MLDVLAGVGPAVDQLVTRGQEKDQHLGGLTGMLLLSKKSAVPEPLLSQQNQDLVHDNQPDDIDPSLACHAT